MLIDELGREKVGPELTMSSAKLIPNLNSTDLVAFTERNL
jgi:hypothetical protein